MTTDSARIAEYLTATSGFEHPGSLGVLEVANRVVALAGLRPIASVYRQQGERPRMIEQEAEAG